MSGRARLLGVLAALVLAAGLLGLSRGVWAPDEARYARVAQEMKAQGAWLVPSLNGDLYAQKPPLLFDLTQAVSLFSDGVPEWAVKVPVLLAALLALLATAWLGRRLVGPEGLWLAPLLLASQFKFVWQAQFGQIDMLVVGLIAAQVALGLGAGEGWLPRGRALAGLSLLGILGVLAKGPVGCALAWGILLAYFSARKDWAGLRRAGLHWVVPAVALLAGLWLLSAGFSAGWDYPRALVFKQTVQRYLEPWHHKAPWYYYLGVLWTDGLPWSLLVVPMAAPLLRKRAWREPAALLPLVWIAVYLLVFSLSSGKRSVYILPLYPALALLGAHGLSKWQEGGWDRKGLTRVLLALAALFGGVLVAAFVAAPAPVRPYLPVVLPGGVALVLCAAVSGLLASRGKVHAAAAALGAGCFLFLALAAAPVVHRLDPVKAPRGFAAAARPRLEAGATLGVFPSLVPSVNYYCDAVTPVFDTPAGAEAFLRETGPRMLLLQRDAWKGPLPAGATVLHEAPLGDSPFVLLAAPRAE